MADIVISIAAKVAELLVVPVGKHICYPFKYESNMEGLKQQVEKLINARDRVQHSVDTAKRQGDEIEKDVEKWLNSVDAFAAQLLVKSIIDGEEDRAKKKLCSIGFCPNLISRYSLSKKAAKIAKDGVDLLAEGNFKDVSHRLAIRRTKSVYTRGHEDFGSRMLVFEKIMKALADEDVNLIGVYGMGGVGKTTLVKRVAAQVMEDKLFDVVVMAEVTQTLDIKNIQKQIADELGLKFEEKSLSGRAARLRDRLKKETNVLVILDNIWEKLNLDDVGIPSLNDERASVTQEVEEQGRNAYKRQCKLLLTCRDPDVLHNDMNTQRNFYVDVLPDIEAMNLFWKIAGHSKEKPDFDPIAVEIVRKCAGLPIAITTFANALKNKDVSDWKDALQWLRRSNPKPIKGMEASVYSTIELSYNILGSEEQLFFLLCCLNNSGGDIFINDLFKYSMGLGLFKDVDTMEEARNRMHSLIGNLKASCLLLDGDAKDFVKMHDIIQAVAVSIASSKDKLMFNIQNVTSIKETLEEKLPKDSIAVSLPDGDIDELPERLEFPKLELLLLQKVEISLQIPDAFLDGVQELKVLDLSAFHLLSLPRSLCMLTNLQTLCLDRCLIGDITIIGELKKLEILSFSYSEIEQLPGEIRQLTRLRLLDLSNCSKLKVIAPDVLSSLSRLEELYMGNSFVQWVAEGQSNASLAELKQLSNLTTLEIHVLDAQIMPQDLFFWKLERYRIFIGDVWDWSGRYETLRTLKLKLNNSFSLSDGIKFLLNRAEDLYLDEPKGGKNVLHELNGEGFQQLKHLHIQNASQIQYIINSVGWGLCSIFPQRLESLVLHNLINLENIYHGQVTEESFSQLKVIKVGKCDKLKYLALPMAGNLSQLQEIEVTHCRKLEQIVLMESRQVHKNEQISKIEFTQLRTLTLQCLPRLPRFGFNVLTPDMRLQEILAEDDPDSFITFFCENVLLPRLENLKLCSINIDCRWLDQLQAVSSCCQTLVKLTVEECNSLDFLFSYSMVKSLVQLRELEIRNCKSMERIINTEESAEEERIVNMIFPKLNWLHLEGLPKLTGFGSGNSIELPSLGALEILDCPRLKMFFSGSTCANITVIEEQEATNSCADIYPLLDKKVLLPSLRHLKLKSIGSQVIWHSQLTAESFSQLKVIIVRKCDKLKYLTLPMAGNLSKLQEIEVTHCRKLEQIVLKEGRQVHKNEQISKIEFTQLRTLTLQWLPRLTRFGFNALTPDMRLQEILAEDDPDSFIPFFSQNVELPRLENLKLCSINIECRWLDQLPAVSSSCQTLAKLIVEECNGLNFLFSYSMVKSLVQLREIVIRNCKSMERIINIEESAAEKRIIYMIFPKLNLLLLEGLPRLTGFGSGNSIEFPSLYTLGILDCPRLKMFFSGSTCANITVSKEQEATNSCADIYPLLDKRVSLPSLRVLKLNSIHSQVIWHSQLLATSSSLHNLTILRIIGLGDLKYLFSSSMANSVVQLNILEIIDCKLMEAVIVEEEKGSSVLLFPNLQDLTLRNLPKLARFCYFNKNLIDRCSSLEQNMTASEECSGMDSKENLQANIQPLFDEKVGLLNIKKLLIEGMDNLRKIWHNQLYPDSFSKLEQVKVYGCNNLLNVYPSNMLGRLQRLEILKVQNCDSVEEIFELDVLGSKKTHAIAAAQLRTLHIHFLPKLKHVWNVESQVILSYQNLHSISVEDCDSLKSLFPASVARGLVQLEELTLHNCMMEEITAKDDGVEVEAVLRFWFPQLTKLELWNLSRLKSFYQGSYISEWPVLKRLEVLGCDEVEILASQVLRHGESRHEIPTGQPLFLVEKVGFPSLEEMVVSGMDNLMSIWHNQFLGDSFSFHKLKSVEVNDCQELMNIFPSCICGRLLSLESLIVKSCVSVKEIFDLRGINLKEKHFTQQTTQLRELYVGHLSNLKHIWNDDPEGMLSYGKLEKVTVFLCPNLENLFPASVAKSLLNLDSLEVSDCGVEVIIAKAGGVKETATDSFLFRQLSSLQLHNLPQLRTFYPGHTVEGPCLKRLSLHHCDKVILFISEFLGFYEAIEEGQLDISIHEQPPFFLVQEIEGTNQRFPTLEELQLSGKAIAMRWPSQVPVHVFRSLKSLELNDHESTVVPLDFIQRFGNLEKLSLNSSSYSNEIFSYGKDKEHPEIKHLVLSGLFDLKQIWKQGSKMDPNFQNLQILEVRSCFNLINLMPSSASFRNLMILEVWGCNRLKNLLTSSTAKSLVLLEKLEVFDCKILTEVVANEGAVPDEIVFGNLKSLSLVYLQSLASFCFTKHTLNFPILESLVVNECPKMKIFSEGVMSTPKLYKLELNWKAIEQSWEVGVNTTIQQNMGRQ